MNNRTLSTILVSVAVIVASVAAIVVSSNRSDAARADAEREAAAADRASAEAKKAKSDAAAADAKAREAEAAKQAADSELAAQTLDKENLKSEMKIAEDQKAAAEAMAAYESVRTENFRLTNETARLMAQRASDERATAEATNLAAQAEAAKKIAECEAEKLEESKASAKKAVLEYRKIDFEMWGERLREKEQELEERERALKPEKTIADLSWAGGMEDTVFDADGNVTNQVKTVYDPEKDMELPEASRNLAKTQRIVREDNAALAAKNRDAILASMEKLYVSALKDRRVIDADFYKKSILTMYPDWKPKDEEKAEKTDEGGEKQ